LRVSYGRRPIATGIGTILKYVERRVELRATITDSQFTQHPRRRRRQAPDLRQ